jgi:hypothetical protein
MLDTTLTATSMHIHSSADSSVAISLDVASGCVDADASTIEAVLTKPTMYYVNLHTDAYPDGAIRGQIAAPAANAAMSFTLEGAQVVPVGTGRIGGTASMEMNFYNQRVRLESLDGLALVVSGFAQKRFCTAIP